MNSIGLVVYVYAMVIITAVLFAGAWAAIAYHIIRTAHRRDQYRLGSFFCIAATVWVALLLALLAPFTIYITQTLALIWAGIWLVSAFVITGRTISLARIPAGYHSSAAG